MKLEEKKDFSRPGRSVTSREIHPESGLVDPDSPAFPTTVQEGLDLLCEGTEPNIVMSGHGLHHL